MSDGATNPMALRDFRARLHGELILPDDDGYDSARRVWNGMIDKYPALLCRCANRADVIRAAISPTASIFPSPSGVAATASLARPSVMGASSSTFLR